MDSIGSWGGVLALLQCTSAMHHEVGSQIVRLLNHQLLLTAPSRIGSEQKHGRITSCPQIGPFVFGEVVADACSALGCRGGFGCRR